MFETAIQIVYIHTYSMTYGLGASSEPHSSPGKRSNDRIWSNPMTPKSTKLMQKYSLCSANGKLVAWVPVVWILSFIRVPFFVRIPFSYGIPGWIMNHYSWIWVLGFFVVKTHTKKEGPAGASRMKFEMHEPFFGKSYHWSLILGPRILLHGF